METQKGRRGYGIEVRSSRHGLETDVPLLNNVLNLYASCGLRSEASHLFNNMPKRDVVSWTTMISCQAQQPSGDAAFDLFHRMQRKGIEPNDFTIVSLLSLCSNPTFAQGGSLLHSLLVEKGSELHVIPSTALVRMYCDCSSLENAHSLFASLNEKDVRSWAILISAYAQHDNSQEAMALFEQMQQEAMMPNNYIYNKLINACAAAPSLEEGQRAHSRVVGTEFEQCIFVKNSLVDMYAKCGSLEFAQEIFTRMSKKDLISWNTIITAFAQYGRTDEVFKHFENLKVEGLKPDEYTFSCLLSVCTSLGDVNLGSNIHEEVRNAGLECRIPVMNALLDMYSKCMIGEACHFFIHMVRYSHVAASVCHCASIVDLLCRAGCLDEAEDFAGRIPFQPNIVILLSFLSACKSHSNADLAEQVSAHVVDLAPTNTAAHILLSNIFYGSARLMDEEEVFVI
ncbi:hypothetical protein GOP47_0017354 [Adiantum capillus-veneris]|uniref:Pentatricopeptide repeat-containing protein n=1 Tax=Adiantum capillus-veneris TaxID=13818 RepID=A0A9D4UGF6_ADICA|nr:hypothetical protein GOP47_0017354 [Adiantum capillus-veneris]